MTMAAIVTAAGRSSRMGQAKMRMPFGAGTVLTETVAHLLEAGVEELVVVTGRDADAVAVDVAHLPVRTIHNPGFAATEMLDSIQLGYRALSTAELLFVMPGDMPLVSPAVIAEMIERLTPEADIALPVLAGQGGHPLLLRQSAAALIPGLTGSMRDLLQQGCVQSISVWDRGILLDVDTPAAYAQALDLYKAKNRLDATVCADIMDYMQLPRHIRAHGEAVAKVAVAFGQALQAQGLQQSMPLIEAAARLHDICRLEPRHEAAGEALLRRLGYPEVGAVIGTHMHLQEADVEALGAKALVFFADKITEETCRVSLEARYRPALEKFPAGTVPGDRIRLNIQHAKCIEARLQTILGSGYEQIIRHCKV